MKAAERLARDLGAHIDESMGAARSAPAGLAGAPPIGPPVHGGPTQYQGCARVKDALAIEVDRIIPDPNQPRKEFDPDDLAHLAASLKDRGQLQPIRVRWDGAAERWVIIAGERRWRAAVLAGLPTLTCIETKGTPSDEEILEDQLVENCLRIDLKPIEQAYAFKALLDRRGCSYRQLAASLHISHQAVVRALALLGLPDDVQDRVTAGQLAPSVAYEVSRLEDPDKQRAVAQEIVTRNLNREEAVATIRKRAGRSSRPGAGKGRAGHSSARSTTRTYRTSQGKVEVTVPRRTARPEDLLAALEEAAGQARDELGSSEAA